MAKTKVPSGPCRIDPQKRSQVIDQFGRNVASVEPDIDASLIATARDMFALLEKLEKDDNSISPALREEIEFADQEWLKFVAALLKPQ